jgi:hypothetical protein
MIATGGKLYEQCYDCGRFVKISGFFGGIHICAAPEQRRSYIEGQQRLQQQMHNQQTSASKLKELLSRVEESV